MTVKDISDEDVIISFDRAEDVPIYFAVEIVLKDGYQLAQVRDSIKQAIVDNFDYAMGEKIIANDFYQYINSIEGIDYVTRLEVSLNGIAWGQTADVEFNEYGTVDVDDITVAEDE